MSDFCGHANHPYGCTLIRLVEGVGPRHRSRYSPENEANIRPLVGHFHSSTGILPDILQRPRRCACLACTDDIRLVVN